MELIADWWLTALGSFAIAVFAIGVWRLVQEPDPTIGEGPGPVIHASVKPVLALAAGLFAIAVLASISISLLAVYFVIWWTVLFAVLPFGVRSQVEAGEVVPGTEPAAPRTPLLLKKVIATSLIAIIVFLIFYWLRFHSGYALTDLPFLPEVHY